MTHFTVSGSTLRNHAKLYALILAMLCVSAQSASYTFTTLAGSDGGAGSFDGTGTAARFFQPQSVAVDIAGNVYVADTLNNTVRKISPSGVVSTLAGKAGSSGSTDSTGAAARFYNPYGVAVDNGGNVYVADTNNDTVRKISPSGVVSTLAGKAGSQGSTDGTGAAAQFNGPLGVAVDSGGNVYVSDSGNNTIRMITPGGFVTTLAGKAGSSGSTDGTGSAARFNDPFGVAVDGSGSVYVADTYNNTVRKISPSGVVSTLAGKAGSQGSTDGPGSAAQFNIPNGIAVDSGGNVYVADTDNYTIRKISPSGVVSTLAGTAESFGSEDGTGSEAQFNGPFGVAVDSGGNVYVADTFNYAIRMISPSGVVSTLAGTAASSGNADGTGATAGFYYPSGVAVDSGGNVYVADTFNSTVRKITPSGVVSTLAGTAGLFGSVDGTGSEAQFGDPNGVAVDSGGNVYVADTDNYTVRKITPSGVVSTLAGKAGSKGSADGTGAAARFNYPSGVAVDIGGNVYVADTGNNTIRMITPGGVVTTLAGKAGRRGSKDGHGVAARFTQPTGVAVDSGGNVYVADIFNSTVRKITPSGVVSTLAGSAGSAGSADGTGAAARFSEPTGVAVDSVGNVYVADSVTNTIRLITPGGVVSTLVSTVQFNSLKGVAVDSSFNVYVADAFSNSIRIGKPSLTDVAVIDSSAGLVGVQRQLSTSPQTATNWVWSIIRQPSGSVASLSSTSISNPTFTPDVADLYVFLLTATNATNTSISTVSLNAGPLTIESLESTQNPALIDQNVTFTFVVTDHILMLNYTLDFGDGSPVSSGTFMQDRAVSVNHAYSAYADAGVSVTLTVSDGTSQVTQSLLQFIPSPSSGGARNILQGDAPVAAPITAPLGGLGLAVMTSDGGVLALGANDSSITRETISLSTDFGDLEGRSSFRVTGTTPVHAYRNHGIFVAHTTASNVSTNTKTGEARLTIPVSAAETGEAAPLTAPSTTITTTNLKGKFDFSGATPDTVSFIGMVQLAAGFDTAKSHEIWLGIGNIVIETTVNNKGTGMVPSNPPSLKSMKFTTKVKPGGISVGGESATLNATYSVAGLVANGFNTEGISAQSTDVGKNQSAPRNIQVALLIDGVPYNTLAPVIFAVSSNSAFGTISGRR